MGPHTHRTIGHDVRIGRLGLWCAVSCVALAGAASTSAARVDADAIAPAVHDAYRLLGGEDVWPGFAPHAIPLAIFDGRRTWLFDHPNPPSDFTATGSDGAAAVRAGRAAEVTANSSAAIGGVSTATLILPASAGRSVDSTRALAAVAIHEAFHVFQRAQHSGWSANEGDLFTYPADDESVLTEVGLEREALRRAVADTAATSAGWARAALAARRRRFARLSEVSVAYERQCELNEGLAQYVQNRVLRLTRAGHDPATVGSGSPRILDGETFPADGVRLRSYVVGEALAVLLDRFLPDWRDSLEAHDTRPLDAWLSERFESAKTPPPALPAAIRAAARDEAHQAIAALHTRRREARTAFLGRNGITLIVEAPAGSPLQLSGFDPLNVLAVGNGEVLHTRWLKLESPAGTLEVFDRDALTASAGPHPLFSGIRRVTITGVDKPLDLEDRGRPAHEIAPGVSASWTDSRVEDLGDRIIVHLLR